MTVRVLTGDCRDTLRSLEDESVQCVVTSPPYWGLRDYKIPPSIWGGDPECKHKFADKTVKAELRKGAGLAKLGERMKGGGHKQSKMLSIAISRGFCRCGAWRGAFGLEPTYQLYVAHAVEIFREVWRVLRQDGTLWLNLGDCYATGAGSVGKRASNQHGGQATTAGGRVIDWGFRGAAFEGGDDRRRAIGAKHDVRKGSNRAQRGDGNGGVAYGPMMQPNRMPQAGLKSKDLCGIPWRVAFGLQDDGWILRRDVIWHKLNPMPESTYDRPTTSHEYLFLFSKSNNTLLWHHRDGRWVSKKPEPDFIWRHRLTREERREPIIGKNWVRVNLWRGFDYYYDGEAIMEPSSPDSHARAARSRSDTHKWADGGPGGQSIAIQSPSAGTYLPVPSGWDQGEGRHGAIHRDGRRQEVGIGHNSRPTKAVPNEATSARPIKARMNDTRPDAPRVFAKQQGANSGANVDRVPGSRKAQIECDGPRPKNNPNFDEALGSCDLVAMRNKRSVWPIATEPFKEAHFATFPPALIEPCILAGSPAGGTVLDPFGGAGTTGLVADRLQRDAILIELNKDYAAMAERRIADDRGGLLDAIEKAPIDIPQFPLFGMEAAE